MASADDAQAAETADAPQARAAQESTAQAGAAQADTVQADTVLSDTGHAPVLGRRALAAWFGAFAVYAAAMIFTRHADGTWAVWGCAGYAVTALLLLAPTGWVIPLTAAIGGALIGPLLWLITTFPPTGEVVVIGQSANYLTKHGTPYLPPDLITGWTSYNPYLPLMELFGLPHAAGFGEVLGDPRIWTTLTTIVVFAAAFAVAAPHRVRDCDGCRRRVAWLTAVAVASPLIAFPLSVGVTDPPIIALSCLVLALADRGKLGWAAVVLAVACAMKTTAWALVPVLAVMAWVRYSPRAATRFTAVTVVATGILALLAAPAALATPAALKQNLIDYPLGISKYKTVAASPLPGHLIAGLGHAGRLSVDVLLVLAVIAFVAWLIKRPPRTARDAAVRLAVGYAVMFTIDPSTRYGYYAYPLAFLGWLALTRPAPQDRERQTADRALARDRPLGRADESGSRSRAGTVRESWWIASHIPGWPAIHYHREPAVAGPDPVDGCPRRTASHGRCPPRPGGAVAG